MTRMMKINLVFALLTVTFLAYLPSLSNGFVNWDDPSYLVQNKSVQTLSFANTLRYFSTAHQDLYKPLVLLSYAIEHHFFGLNPLVYHVTNLLLHLMNTALVFLFIYLLTKKTFVPAFVTALLFGIHPMHVESVAWVSERKDVLYTLFFLAALCTYLQFRETRKAAHFVTSVLAFSLSLLCKPMGLSLPLLLLLINYVDEGKITKQSLIEKIPFFTLALIVGLFSVWTYASYMRQAGLPIYFSVDTLFIASFSTLFYVVHLMFPYGLSVYYAYPSAGSGIKQLLYFFSPFALVFFSFLLVPYLKRSKDLLFGVLFFLLALMPALQLLPTYNVAITADHYTYVPSIGLFFILGVWLEQSQKRVRLGILTAITVLCFLLTWQRCHVWKDGVTFWTDALKHNPKLTLALNNRSAAYYSKGDYENAIKDNDASIAINRFDAVSYNSRGNTYFRKGDVPKAFVDFNRALVLNPRYAEAYYNRGNAWKVLGRYEKALLDYTLALTLQPNFIYALNNRGNIYRDRMAYKKAIADYEKILKIDPSDELARRNLQKTQIYFQSLPHPDSQANR